MANIRATLDHLLLGAADLDQGIEWFEKMTGVKAGIGGRHPGAGTRNALVSLGGMQYLEIIAPDPEQTVYAFPIDVRALAEPRLITWAAATSDIETVAENVRGAGRQALGPLDGSRLRPDGKALKWKTLRAPNEFGLNGVEPIPFLIEWSADSLHPSQDSSKGCELLSFEIEHPYAEGAIEMLKVLGIEMEAKQAKNAALKATLKTPKGIVELGSALFT